MSCCHHKQLESERCYFLEQVSLCSSSCKPEQLPFRNHARCFVLTLTLNFLPRLDILWLFESFLSLHKHISSKVAGEVMLLVRLFRKELTMVVEKSWVRKHSEAADNYFVDNCLQG